MQPWRRSQRRLLPGSTPDRVNWSAPTLRPTGRLPFSPPPGPPERHDRPPALLNGRRVYVHDTAREVRDRFVDLMCVDRPDVALPVVDMPWIERGRVLPCAADLDDLWAYGVEGTDGSWAGKKFQITNK